MELRLPIAAITDEFTPQLESALGAMAPLPEAAHAVYLEHAEQRAAQLEASE